MKFEVTCFEIGFKNCILEICDVYVNSKFFFNQNISKGFKKYWEIFVIHNFSKKFFSNLVKLRKNGRDYQSWRILVNEIANWEQIAKSYWLNSVSECSYAPFFLKILLYLVN